MEQEQCYGVVIVLRDNNEDKFLIVQHEPEQHEDEEGDWSFPKGHHEGNETPKETALREVQEETGITEIEFLDFPLIHEEYEIARDGGNVLKNNDYFIGFVNNASVKIQEGEIKAYKWATFDEAMKTFQYENRKNILKIAKEYINLGGIYNELNKSLPINIIEKLPRRYKTRAILLTPDKKVILIHVQSSDRFILPGGKMESGETIFETLIRECKEETGYDISIIAPLGCVKINREEYVSVNFLFLAQITGIKDELSLMDDEILEGHDPVVLDFNEAMKVVDNDPQSYELLVLVFQKAKQYLENYGK